MRKREPGGGRKRKITLAGRAQILQSNSTVKELSTEYNVSLDTIYKLIRDRHKPNLNFVA